MIRATLRKKEKGKQDKGDEGYKRGGGSGPVLTGGLGIQGKVRTEQMFGEGKKESTRKPSKRGRVFQVERENRTKALDLFKEEPAGQCGQREVSSRRDKMEEM